MCCYLAGHRFWYTKQGHIVSKRLWTILQVLKIVPVFIIVLAFGVFYVNSLSELGFGLLRDNWIAQAIYLVSLHMIYFLVMSTYFRCVFSKAAPIPDAYKLPLETFNDLIRVPTYQIQQIMLKEFISSQNLEINETDFNGCIRMCPTCVIVKPDRCHHCRKCGVCAIGFDHHCPWIANCVHSRNKKLFVLLLLYSQILCIFGFLTSYSLCSPLYFGRNFQSVSRSIISIALIQFSFGVVTLILLVTQCFLILINSTSLEFGIKIRSCGQPNVYNLGWRQNFLQVFGNEKILWLLPVVRKGDTIHFISQIQADTRKIVQKLNVSYM